MKSTKDIEAFTLDLAFLLTFDNKLVHLEIDEYTMVKYNTFNNITYYHTEMSAMGDFHLFQSVGRIANVSRPFIVVRTLDNSLIT